MILSECLSIKLSQILQSDDSSYQQESHETSPSIIQAQHEWNAAIASLQNLLSTTIDTEKIKSNTKQGIIISSSTPIINDIKLVSQLETVVFSPPSKTKRALMPCEDNFSVHLIAPSSFIEVPLEEQDILQEEQFALVLTDKFACVIVKTENEVQENKFYFSFTPEVIKKVWYLLKVRLIMSHDNNHDYIQKLVNQFFPDIPSYQIVSKFTRNLLTALKQQELSHPHSKSINKTEVKSKTISLKKVPANSDPELELLQALTHEIRTPLTTIKTVTKLLKRKAKLTTLT
jgi:predicted nuclease of restriction endonuclease-like (RecB) superfamily